MNRFRSFLALALAVSCLFTACSNMTRLEKEDAKTAGFAVNKSWANSARAVISPDTPHDEDVSGSDPRADYGPKDDRDRNELADLDDDDDLGDVIVDLPAGVFTLDRSVLLRSARGVVIRGKGPSKTRLQLDGEELRALRIKGAKRVVIHDLTIVGLTGGGLFIEGCPDVVVKNTHFAALRYGLNLSESVARVSSSVFAGCQTGIRVRDESKLTLRETAFGDCWTALRTTASGLDIESCVFLDNRRVVKGSLDHRSRLVGSLLFGHKQELGWEGRPRIARDNLCHFRGLGVRLGTETNRELRSINDFPHAIRWPQGMDLVAVHLTQMRMKKRGEKDYEQVLEDVEEAETRRFAEASQKAIRARDLVSARYLARIALRYWGKRSLKDAPEELVQIAELAK